MFFSDFDQQLEVSMLDATAKYTHVIAPVDPGNPAEQFELTQSDFKILYKINESLVDDFGNTPPVFSHLPYVGFSISELELGKSTLGPESINDLPGVLQSVSDFKTYTPTAPSY